MAAAMLTIAANLLPEEIIALRRMRKYRRIVIISLVVLVAGLAVGYGVARYQTSVANSRLAAAESDIRRLNRQQTSYTELIRIQAESQAIKSQLAVLMANDLQWASLLSSLEAAAPQGVVVIGITASLSSKTSGAATSNKSVPRSSTTKTVGTVSVKATAPSKEVIAAYVDALGGVEGLATPMLGEMSLQGEVLRFTVRLDITSDALDGRFSAKPDRKVGEG